MVRELLVGSRIMTAHAERRAPPQPAGDGRGLRASSLAALVPRLALALALAAAACAGWLETGTTDGDADADADTDLREDSSTPGCDPATCDDGDPCNGVETCVAGECVGGTPVLDADRDGFERADCGGDDCDDLDADARPGGVEICFDGADNDCDGQVDPPSCALAGDRCTDPIPIRIPAGASIEKDFWLDLARFGRHHNFRDAECCPWPECAAGADCCPWESEGPEAVYRLELGAETTLTLDLVSEEVRNPVDVIVYLRDDCSPVTTLECWDDISDAGDSGIRVLVRDLVLPAGTYFLFVDAFEADPFEPDPEVPDPDSYRVNFLLRTGP